MAAKSKGGRKRQTTINFSPTTKPSSSTRTSTATKIGQAQQQPGKLSATKAMTRKSSRVAKNTQPDESSEDELAIQTKKAVKLGQPANTANGMFDNSEVDSGISDSSKSEVQERQKEKPASRKRQRAATPSDTDDETPTVKILPRKRQRLVEVREVPSSEEEVPRVYKKKRGARQKSTPEDSLEVHTPRTITRGRLSRRLSPSSEEDDMLVLPRKRQQKISHTQLGSDGIEPRINSRRRSNAEVSGSESESQDGQENNVEIQGDLKKRERDELKEDLAFLRSSPSPERGQLRSTQGKPKNERQKALEALKKKRAGNTETRSSATPIRKKPVVIETDSSSDLEMIEEESKNDEQINDDDEDDEDEGSGEPEANALDMFQESEDDNGFIDDNPDAVIGEPTADADLDDMRLAFSFSRAKSKDLFKHAVEWMVMKKIHPAFDSTRNFYTLTFRKLDDEVIALAGSKFVSSSWTPDFTRAVRARPDLLVNDISGIADLMSPHCAACNRKNHPATWELRLMGQPYDKYTLEPLEQDTSSDSDSNSDSSSLSASPPHALTGATEKPDRNAEGEPLLPESYHFQLGSTCKANAQVSHTLLHWRYHLYQWVKQYLAQQGHLTAEKLVRRDSWSDRKRQKAAMKIVDKMESEGEIRKLWRLYKEQVTFAVEATNEYKDGWGRRR